MPRIRKKRSEAFSAVRRETPRGDPSLLCVDTLADYIDDSGIDYWIYGHSHRNIDNTIGTTRCLCNQFGYVSHNEHLTFDRGKVIDV